jgi:endogenous inhibitor of DNA gyrase (YacG/DUF329 family)
MDDIKIKIDCPKCQHPVEATLKKVFKLIMYTCPKCQSNVVFYDNKVDIISDAMVYKLRNNKKLQFFAMTNKKSAPKSPKTPKVPAVKKFRRSLSEDDIMDLKILLETEKDSGSFLSKI